HDLQEPLRTIVGYSRLLETECGASLEEHCQEYLQTVIEGGKRMQQLISDLLDYSRVGRHNRPLQPTSLNSVIEQSLALLYSTITERQANVSVGDLPEIPADAGLMTRLFQNLIGNAVKYNRSDRPQVVIEATEDADGRTIFISDNGIGIPQEQSERVFEIFQRLHSREEFAGTGIGLAVCRRIADRHGGTLRIVYNHDTGRRLGGTTFELRLPAAK
ncbi:MAG: hypothetical protein KDA89_01880, partial [Planctomycetaceae bacterium]|nr:hypothetical protein [Planctomycetaceae bacterium]